MTARRSRLRKCEAASGYTTSNPSIVKSSG